MCTNEHLLSKTLTKWGKGAGEQWQINIAKLQDRRKATTIFFLSKSHIQLKGQVFDRNQWNLWTFASLGILSLHVPCTSMACKSVALPYDFQMRYRSTGHLTTYDIFRYFYRFPDRMRPCDIGGRKKRLSLVDEIRYISFVPKCSL